jgi:DNA-binding transcriptional MerR regulator
MFTANELAKKTDVPIFTIRHYTKIGLLKPLKNQQNGYKMYQIADSTRLKFIIAAKNLGFTLHEISEILDKANTGNSPCPMVREIVQIRLEENKRKIRELKNLQKKMESALGDWSKMKDSTPNGESVCGLIESVAELKN